jgi:hypothetical protein
MQEGASQVSATDSVVEDKLTGSRCDGTCVSVTTTTHCFLRFQIPARIFHGHARAILLLLLSQFGGAIALRPSSSRSEVRYHWFIKQIRLSYSASVLETTIGIVAAGILLPRSSEHR